MKGNSKQLIAQASAMVAFLAYRSEAAIAQDGLWTDQDWYDPVYKIGVTNGVPYSDDIATQRRIQAPISFDGDVSENYLMSANVERIMSIFNESDWQRGFPLADQIYTYDNFLRAAAKFPYFCNETNLSDQSLETACRRELASIFAHWGQETGKRSWAEADGEFWTQGLYHVEEMDCKGGNSGWCDYKSTNWSKEEDAWPPQSGAQYYGRGPFQLSWNYNYGQFSNIFAPSSYNSKLFFLEQPELIHQDGALAMSSGIWFYMTPQDPKPSMHDVMTGFFVPTDADLAVNIGANFGTTTNIINGGLECHSWNQKQKDRGQYYLKWLNFFDLQPEDSIECGNQSAFPAGGAGDVPGFWDISDQDGEKACRPVETMTQYAISARDDYKRCVCDKIGSGESDCPQDNSDPEPQPDPEPSPSPNPQPDPQPQPDVWKTDKTLEEIRASPHFSSVKPSRTSYQVDRSVSMIEMKFKLLLEAVQDKGLL